MNKPKSAESRTNDRVPLNTVVRYSHDGMTWKEGRSKDISISGMFLMETDPEPQGQPLRLSFNLPNVRYQGEIQVDAEVVRSILKKGHPQGVGLRFKTLRGRNYEVLLEFVNRVLGVPLPEGFRGAGEAGQDGTYTLHMDRLLEEIVDRQVEAKLAKSASLETSSNFTRVLRLLLWLALIVGLGAVGYAFLSYVAVLTGRLG